MNRLKRNKDTELDILNTILNPLQDTVSVSLLLTIQTDNNISMYEDRYTDYSYTDYSYTDYSNRNSISISE